MDATLKIGEDTDELEPSVIEVRSNKPNECQVDQSTVKQEKLTLSNEKNKKGSFLMSSCDQAILAISAVIFFIIAVILSNQDITQLVGQSIPVAALGFGILTCIISVLGVVANYRKWILGFYIQVISLFILMLSEIAIGSACAFEAYEIFSDSDVYWNLLDDRGKSQVMANWQCCGWKKCRIGDHGNIYHAYRYYQDETCFDKTKQDIRNWMMDILIIFLSFAGFHSLFVLWICTCQVQRRKNARRREVKKGVHSTLHDLKQNMSSSFSTSMRLLFQTSNSPKDEMKNATGMEVVDMKDAPGMGVKTPPPTQTPLILETNYDI